MIIGIVNCRVMRGYLKKYLKKKFDIFYFNFD